MLHCDITCTPVLQGCGMPWCMHSRMSVLLAAAASDWHCCAPCLPQAPTPFLMGLHSSVELDSRSLEGILVLDLDR